MTEIVNIYDAKTHLSLLVDRATAGEDILIARAGKPVVRLVPVEDAGARRPGLLRELRAPDTAFTPLSVDELTVWG